MGPRWAWLAVLVLGVATLWVVTDPVSAGAVGNATENLGDGLKVGFSRVDITPDPVQEKVWLAGFGRGRQAQKGHDKLWVRACVLEHGGKKLAFACPDLIGLFDEQVRGAEESLRAKGLRRSSR